MESCQKKGWNAREVETLQLEAWLSKSIMEGSQIDTMKVVKRAKEDGQKLMKKSEEEAREEEAKREK